MAIYHVIHACGHHVDHTIKGNKLRRDASAVRRATEVCEGCGVEHAEAQAKAEGFDLAMLAGSPKQVAWASAIRARSLDLFHDHGDKSFQERYLADDPRVERIEAALGAAGFAEFVAKLTDLRIEIITELGEIGEAKWWINDGEPIHSVVVRRLEHEVTLELKEIVEKPFRERQALQNRADILSNDAPDGVVEDALWE